MDNQFDNNIYGFEPQKPLTEKPGTPEPEDIPKESEPAPQPPVPATRRNPPANCTTP